MVAATDPTRRRWSAILTAAALAVVGLPAAAAHAAAKPDLVVASIGAAPQAPQLQGHAFGISESTRNRGTDPSDSSSVS